MELVLGDQQGKIYFEYLDDIIISNTFEQHSSDIQAVLNKLQKENLTVNMKKNQYFQTSLKFLGQSGSSHWEDQGSTGFRVPQNSKGIFLGVSWDGWVVQSLCALIVSAD